MSGSIKDFFPFFVIGFIFLSFVRTIGDHLFLDKDMLDYWKFSLAFFKEISIHCILFSMVALGLQTNLKSMFKLGFKPLIIGFVASATVGAVSIVYLY